MDSHTSTLRSSPGSSARTSALRTLAFEITLSKISSWAIISRTVVLLDQVADGEDGVRVLLDGHVHRYPITSFQQRNIRPPPFPEVRNRIGGDGVPGRRKAGSRITNCSMLHSLSIPALVTVLARASTLNVTPEALGTMLVADGEILRKTAPPRSRSRTAQFFQLPRSSGPCAHNNVLRPPQVPVHAVAWEANTSTN